MAFAIALVGMTAVGRAESGAGGAPAPAAAPAGGGVVHDEAEAQRLREQDEMQRRDVAAALARLGVIARWEDHPLRELADWRARVEAAGALRAEAGVKVDWRTTSLRALRSMRLRAAKAARLEADFNVAVDWRRHTWRQLEDIRRRAARAQAVAAFQQTTGPFHEDALLEPGGAGAARRPGLRPRDPDAVIEPSFTLAGLPSWSTRRSRLDPDGILVPTYVAAPAPATGGDDVLAPFNPRRR